MKAQNEFGRNSNEFIRWINTRTDGQVSKLRQILFDAWKEGYEPSAVFEYLHSEMYLARVEFGMKMTSMTGHYGDALKEQEHFDSAYEAYRKQRDASMTKVRNENMPKL